jgi:hypothetical protein
MTMQDENLSTMTTEEVRDAFCAQIRELTLAELDGVGGGSHIDRPPGPVGGLSFSPQIHIDYPTDPGNT